MSLPVAQSRSRAAFVTTLVLVFFSGAVAGAVAVRMRPVDPSIPFYTQGGQRMSVARLKGQLDLTPEQAGEIESILDDFNTFYRNITFDGKARILKILNEDQQKKFLKMSGETPPK